MNITRAIVVDPRREGLFKEPYLRIEIDENLRQTREPRECEAESTSWLIEKFGPYMAVDQWSSGSPGEWTIGNLGVFNTTKLHRVPLVGVMVVSPDEEMDLAMDLDRARRLLRQRMQPWSYEVDDIAAQRGELLWRLIERPAYCVRCLDRNDENRVSVEAFHRNTHLPLCVKHVREHNQMIRELRQSAASN